VPRLRGAAAAGGGATADYTRRVSGSTFERIVCGVDGSPESLEAVRQSDVLLPRGGSLVLVAAVDLMQAVHVRATPTAVHAARHMLEDVEKLDQEAANALERARAQVTRASDVLSRETGGPPASSLLEAAAAERATLVAVGTHGLGRAAGVVLGSVATRVVHRAPCSVLIARRLAGDWCPRTVVVGVDGSEGAEAALHACRELESRLGADVRVVTSTGRRPAHELLEAAAAADLLAVGSRATHHAFGLGSVSEHVAHHARCSVLVVRAVVDAPAP
jgi:nucleotide-binding universal stress UspA family protein